MAVAKLRNKTKIALLPVPGAGHLIPMVEMAQRLLNLSSNFSITVLILPPIPSLPCNVDSYVQTFKHSTLDITFKNLDAAQIPENAGGGEFMTPLISIFVENHKPHIKSALSECGATVVIIDLFATSAIDVADELGVPTYLYFASGAAMLAVVLYSHVLNQKHKFPIDVDVDEGKDEPMYFDVPGLHPIPSTSLPLSLTNRNGNSFFWFVYHGRNFLRTRGMILNSITELERATIEAIAEGKHSTYHSVPPLYTVGPILRCDQETNNSHPCVHWLDKQPQNSVVFLCFGSMGSFAPAQLKEIAAGLERSGLRFLWSVRVKSSMDEAMQLEEVFPEGFLEETKERGFVWFSLVPQVEILSHEAIGGFVTHCGWNSALESVWHGVPMLAWPLYSEQHLNAFQLVKEIGIAIELKIERSGFVCAKELERGLRCLMEEGSKEGQKVREKSESLKEESRRAVAKGGSSYMAFDQLVVDLANCNM